MATCEVDVSDVHRQIALGLCPVCGVKRGHRAPRSSVMAHMRSAGDAAHDSWRRAHWAATFARGAARPEADRAQRTLQQLVHNLGHDTVAALLLRVAE